MAKAIKEVKQVEVTKIEEQEIITLELSKEEAEFLLFILQNVAGCAFNSPRKIADDIAKALCYSDVEYPDLDKYLKGKLSCHFSEYSGAN